MATLVNRHMFWALLDKVLPCVVTSQNLENATVEVLLENGARHTVDAYDVRSTEESAIRRRWELINNYNTLNYMATKHEGVI